jgi:hypothetical protein
MQSLADIAAHFAVGLVIALVLASAGRRSPARD